MSRVGFNWHTGPAILYSKDIVRDLFKRYSMGLGLRDKTANLILWMFEEQRAM
jgi:hypothetical protein